MQFKVNDKVQKIVDYYGDILDAVITKIILPTETKPANWRYTNYNDRHKYEINFELTFDDKTTQIVFLEDFEKRDTPLERQFRVKYLETTKQINDKVEQAQQLLQEAINISDEKGVPFNSKISPINQPYIPKNVKNKKKVHKIFGYDLSNSGWLHSDIC